MKSKQELEQSIIEIVNKINECVDKLTDAMCSNNTYRERQYQEEIEYLESRKEVLEWVLG